MASLIDTNILLYAYDPRFPAKQRIAVDLLRAGVADAERVLAHQVLVEFVSAAVRPRKDMDGSGVLSLGDAILVVEKLMEQFVVLYPEPEVLRTALSGAAKYRLSWYDAHLWAYAEVNGLDEILTEDFEHGRYYGSVRAHDPFLAAADSVHELPAMYDG